MEALKIKSDEIHNMTFERVVEVEDQLRKHLFDLRLDIYSDGKAHVGKRRGLKRQLARVLTRKSGINLKKGK